MPTLTTIHDSSVPTAPANLVTGSNLRAATAHFPTGVAVVSTTNPIDEPVGCTVSSFLPVSLEPPIIAVSLAHTSSTLSHLRGARRFAISVLSSQQSALAHIFADREVSHVDRFRSVHWHLGTTGVPVIATALSTLECEVHQIIGTGDHALVLGSVTSLFVSGQGAPLVHHQGSIKKLQR